MQGDSVWVTWQTGYWSFLGLGTDHKALYENNKLCEDGKEYTGDNSFAQDALNALNNLESGQIGNLIVDNLVEGDMNYTIQKGSENLFNYGTKTISWNPNKTFSGLDENGSNDRPAFIGLGHELGHAFDYNGYKHGIPGSWDGNEGFQNPVTKEIIYLVEKTACRIENMILNEHQLTRRKYYSTTEYGTAKIFDN